MNYFERRKIIKQFIKKYYEDKSNKRGITVVDLEGGDHN